MMIAELFLIGIGTGNPAHVTQQAISQLKAADIIMIPRKGSEKSDLADLRHQICDELLGALPCRYAIQPVPICQLLMPGMTRLQISGKIR